MASELIADYSPLLRVYKDGSIERLIGETTVPPSLSPQNGVVSKDTLYSPQYNLSVRLYLPHKFIETDKKLPLLVYFHGGGFLIETAFSPTYHNFLTSAVAITDCVAVSVDYRRAPENPVPIPYEDSWEALKWIFTHFNGSGQDDWINKHADFTKVYLSGDSAGANIAHHMTMKAGKEKLTAELNDSGILGIILIHPYFWSKTPIDEFDSTDLVLRMKIEGIWDISSPNSENGADDPLLNVVGSDSSDLSSLGCRRVLVMVAEKDALVRQGWGYAAKVEKSGWKGEMKVILSKDEEHVFHLMRPDCENAREVFNTFSNFITNLT